ncbi:hypothetical protein [Amylibacter sp. SFDW26]|uniref:hypothetical protein n=1 Tax=Amylibacter sp. SFDW26 TaxID=2652722 RepID=UPI001869DC68|nr:hypothetical protein [Amylibacter sp. SFDW26]
MTYEVYVKGKLMCPYASGDHVVIEDALANITEMRRMKSNRVLDWILSHPNDDAGGV